MRQLSKGVRAGMAGQNRTECPQPLLINKMPNDGVMLPLGQGPRPFGCGSSAVGMGFKAVWMGSRATWMVSKAVWMGVKCHLDGV